MGEKTIIVTIILSNVIFLMFMGGIIMFIRQYKLKKGEHEVELKNKEELHKKELLQAQVEIQTQTMAHIGREIHDNIGQKLTLASIYAKQFGYENQSEEVTQKLESIDNILNESLVELRRLSKTLTDSSIGSYSIQQLISMEIEKVKSLKQCHVECNLDESVQIKSYQSKTVLVRVVQEFIQNSLKHANCEKITVSLQENGGEIELKIWDDGKGFDLNKKVSGIGLENIKKRVELIRGTHSLISELNIGTKLTINIPKE